MKVTYSMRERQFPAETDLGRSSRHDTDQQDSLPHARVLLNALEWQQLKPRRPRAPGRGKAPSAPPYEPYRAFGLEIPSAAPVSGLLASLGAEFGAVSGAAEPRLPGLTYGEGVRCSNVAGDRPLRQAPFLIVAIRQQSGLARHLAGIGFST